MAYEIELRHVSPRNFVAVEFTATVEDIPQQLEEAFSAVIKYLEDAGVQPQPVAMARYTPPENGNFRVAAGFPVASPVPGDGHVVPIELPGGEVACTTHVGPYENLPQTYDAIFAWLKEHGREAGNVMWEEYHSPPDTPPEQIRTEVFWPVK